MRHPQRIAPPGGNPDGAGSSLPKTTDNRHDNGASDHVHLHELPDLRNSRTPLRGQTPNDPVAWRNGVARPIGEVAQAVAATSCPRFARLVEHLCHLGERAVAELLLEVADFDDLMLALERYAKLDPGMVHAIGADRLPPPPIGEVGR